MAIIRNAVMLGMKKYSPPWVSTNKRQVGGDVGRAAGLRVRLHDELAGHRVVGVPPAGDRAGVVAGIEVEPVVQPLLLDELELAEQAGAERHDEDAVLRLVVRLAPAMSP